MPDAYHHTALQHVYKVRPLISLLFNLLGTQALNRAVALSTLALVVLPPQQGVQHQRSTEQEQDQICKNNTMARIVGGRVLIAVDVRGSNTIEVSPAYEETQRDTSLVYTCLDSPLA